MADERDALWQTLNDLDRALPIVQPDAFHVWRYINQARLVILDEHYPADAERERAKPQNM